MVPKVQIAIRSPAPFYYESHQITDFIFLHLTYVLMIYSTLITGKDIKHLHVCIYVQDSVSEYQMGQQLQAV